MKAHIRRLVAADASQYRDVRNRGLAEFPDAFTTSHAEGLATTPESLAKRFGSSGTDDFMLGAFVIGDDGQERLVGHAGFQREQREKIRHKGTLISMYVTPEARGAGLGRALVARLLAEARALDGLTHINLSVTANNESACALYRSFGFEVFGIERSAIVVDGATIDKTYMALALRVIK